MDKEDVIYWGAWVAQLVKRLTSAHVLISQRVGLSPTLGSVLTTQSLKPAFYSVSPSLYAPPLLALCLSPNPVAATVLHFLRIVYGNT